MQTCVRPKHRRSPRTSFPKLVCDTAHARLGSTTWSRPFLTWPPLRTRNLPPRLQSKMTWDRTCWHSPSRRRGSQTAGLVSLAFLPFFNPNHHLITSWSISAARSVPWSRPRLDSLLSLFSLLDGFHDVLGPLPAPRHLGKLEEMRLADHRRRDVVGFQQHDSRARVRQCQEPAWWILRELILRGLGDTM